MGSQKTCSRCHRIGQPCTWKFVDAHAVARQVALRLGRDADHSAISSHGDCANELPESSPDYGTTVAHQEPVAEVHKAGSSRRMRTSDAPVVPVTTVSVTGASELETDGLPHLRRPANFQTGLSRIPDPGASGTNASLNLGFLRSSFDQIHTGIMQNIQPWCSERWLSRGSNPFRESSPGSLAADTVERQGLWWRKAHASPGSGAQGMRELTLLDAAKLLDSFAGLYGNFLSGQDRHEAVASYDAVIRTWSMQWLPCADTGCPDSPINHQSDGDRLLKLARAKDVYAAHWWRARQLLLNTRGSPSFVRILAVFWFSMTAIPDAIQRELPHGERPFDLLDRGLLQLQALLRMLHDFSARLSPSSKYRLLLENVNGMFEWFAYLRDTSTSAASDRYRMLPDVSLPCGGPIDTVALESDASAKSDDSSDTEIACHKLSISAIALWRNVACLKELIRSDDDGPADDLALLESCMLLIRTCEAREVRLLEHSLQKSERRETTTAFGEPQPCHCLSIHH